MKRLVIFCICLTFFGSAAYSADYISSVSESQTLYGNKTTAILWAKVNPPTGIVISRVWAEISDPLGSSSDFDLSDPDNDGVYEGVYSNFTLPGDYVIHFYVNDISDFVERTVSKIEPNADEYEQDDVFTQANSIVLNSLTPQQHNFHKTGDADWVSFYGSSGKNYTVTVNNIGINSDAAIELYDSDGTTKLIDSQNTVETTRTAEWTCVQNGIYYVKLTNSNPNLHGETANYKLGVRTTPYAGNEGFVTGIVRNALSGDPIPNVRIKTTGSGLGSSGKNGEYKIIDSPGDYTLTAELEGFQKYDIPVTIATGITVTKNLTMFPGDLSGDGKIDLADAIAGLRVLSGIPCTVYKQADVNKDERIGLEEVIYILQKIAGLR